MSDEMIKYWTNFARTGDPNGPGLPQWSEFRDGRKALQLEPGSHGFKHVDVASDHKFDLWSSVGK